MSFPDVAQLSQRVASVEPPRRVIDTHRVKVRHGGKLFRDIAVTADDAASVAEHADDAAMLPVILFLLVRLFELAKQAFRHFVPFGGTFDLPDEARPRYLFEFIQHLAFSVLSLFRHESDLLFLVVL